MHGKRRRRLANVLCTRNLGSKNCTHPPGGLILQAGIIEDATRMEHAGEVGVPEDLGIFPGASIGADERDVTVAVRWTGSHPAGASSRKNAPGDTFGKPVTRQASERSGATGDEPVTRGTIQRLGGKGYVIVACHETAKHACRRTMALRDSSSQRLFEKDAAEASVRANLETFCGDGSERRVGSTTAVDGDALGRRHCSLRGCDRGA